MWGTKILSRDLVCGYSFACTTWRDYRFLDHMLAPGVRFLMDSLAQVHNSDYAFLSVIIHVAEVFL